MFRFARGGARTALLAGALGIGLTAGVLAQEQYPEAKLDSFVSAAIQVEQLIQEWSPKIEGAADESAAEEMREQANAELAAAIEQTDGITVAEYQEIAQAARTDQALSARLKELYQAKTGG